MLEGQMDGHEDAWQLTFTCQRLVNLVANNMQLPPTVLRALFSRLLHRRTLYRVSLGKSVRFSFSTHCPLADIFSTLKKLQVLYPELWIPQPTDWPLFKSVLTVIASFSDRAVSASASSHSHSHSHAASSRESKEKEGKEEKKDKDKDKDKEGQLETAERIIQLKKAVLLLKFFTSVLLADVCFLFLSLFGFSCCFLIVLAG